MSRPWPAVGFLFAALFLLGLELEPDPFTPAPFEPAEALRVARTSPTPAAHLEPGRSGSTVGFVPRVGTNECFGSTSSVPGLSRTEPVPPACHANENRSPSSRPGPYPPPPLSDTVRSTITVGTPLITSLPRELHDVPVSRYTILRGPALSGVAGYSLTWITRGIDPGTYDVRLQAQHPDARPDTLVLRVEVEM